MQTDEQAPRRARSAFEDLRRSVISRLRELGFRTTGGVARLLADGNCGVIQFQKSSGSTPESTTFTVNIGVALGGLMPAAPAKPLSHCSDRECHAQLRIGDLAEPRSEVWWTLAVDRPDPAVLAEVLGRVERDAVPFVQRAVTPGVLAALWESGQNVGVNDAQRLAYLRRLSAARVPGGPAGA